VPRVGWLACRHGTGGLFWQLFSGVVVFANLVGQVVLYVKIFSNSSRILESTFDNWDVLPSGAAPGGFSFGGSG
jgi:hypothetical protein